VSACGVQRRRLVRLLVQSDLEHTPRFTKRNGLNRIVGRTVAHQYVDPVRRAPTLQRTRRSRCARCNWSGSTSGLKAKDTPLLSQPAVKFFVMAPNRCARNASAAESAQPKLFTWKAAARPTLSPAMARSPTPAHAYGRVRVRPQHARRHCAVSARAPIAGERVACAAFQVYSLAARIRAATRVPRATGWRPSRKTDCRLGEQRRVLGLEPLVEPLQLPASAPRPACRCQVDALERIDYCAPTVRRRCGSARCACEARLCFQVAHARSCRTSRDAEHRHATRSMCSLVLTLSRRHRTTDAASSSRHKGDVQRVPARRRCAPQMQHELAEVW